MVRTWARWASLRCHALSQFDVALGVVRDDRIVAPAAVPEIRVHDEAPGTPVGQEKALVLAQIDPNVAGPGRLERLPSQSHAVDPLPGMLAQHQHGGKRDLLACRVGVLAGGRWGKPIGLDGICFDGGLGDPQVSVETAFVAPAPIARTRGLAATTLGVPGHPGDCTASCRGNERSRQTPRA